jgi:MFS family permease
MIALAVALSSYGLYQYFHDMPMTRAAYEANPDLALQQAGESYPEGSRERQLFEQRLRSTEPMATFALANSLAGVLAPWLVALAVVATSVGTVTHGRKLAWLGAAVAAGVIAFCLVLTKSRSAYLATAVGIASVALGLAWRRGNVWRRGKGAIAILVAAGVAAALLVAVAIGVGGLDVEVLSEAPKSLGYRLQYWQSTRAMIADAPLTGVGPGNFGDEYTRYKLPEASEEITDPHNFLLEVAATAGMPALLALGLLLVLLARSEWCSRANRDDATTNPSPPEMSDENMNADRALIDATMYVVWGGLAGFVVAFMLGDLVSIRLPMLWMIAGVVIAGGVIASIHPWIGEGEFTAGGAALLAGVLLINLLVAGGFTMPAVAGSFWLLLAIGQSLADGDHPVRPMARPVGRGLGLAMFAAVAALAVVCHSTMYVPVVYAKAHMDAALTDTRGPEFQWQNAAERDRWSTEPRRMLCASLFSRLMKQPHDEFLTQRFADATDDLLRLRPHSSALWAQVAGWRLAVYGRNQDADTLAGAIEAARWAAELYPSNARRRVQLAVVLEAADEFRHAKAEAVEALRLDELTPHVDQKLSEDLRETAARLAAAAN